MPELVNSAAPPSAPLERSLRALGIDYGTKRIGVAQALATQIATPYGTLQIDTPEDLTRFYQDIGQIVAKAQIQIIWVGIPLTLQGTIGSAAQRALVFTNELTEHLVQMLGAAAPPIIHGIDERLTTTAAQRQLVSAPGKRHRKGAAGKSAYDRVIDQQAAVNILQSALDTWYGTEKLAGRPIASFSNQADDPSETS